MRTKHEGGDARPRAAAGIPLAERSIRFRATLLRPANVASQQPWTFVVLPKEASGQLPRRGRITVDGTLDGCAFRATLEPDGQLSHWLAVGEQLRLAAGAAVGDTVSLCLSALEEEPDPDVPVDLLDALRANPDARATWDAATALARVDWIHWISSARRDSTRSKRVAEACDKLASGARRVCCFDASGFYSKAFSAPRASDE